MSKVLIVDTETTGLDRRAEAISIGLVLCEIDDANGRPIGEPVTYHGLRMPSVSIHPAASRIHGHTATSLSGMDFDHSKIQELFGLADVLIAHNAAFDARILRSLYPEVMEKSWRCSWRQWPWGSTQGTRKLSDAIEICGVTGSHAHRAIDDALALWGCLQSSTGKTTRSRTYLHKLLGRPAFEIELYVQDDLKRRPIDDNSSNERSSASGSSKSRLYGAASYAGKVWSALSFNSKLVVILVTAAFVVRCTSPS